MSAFRCFLFIFVAFVIGVRSDCISCICQQESQCQAIGCNDDVGSLSCGYFQIKLPYYQDCGTPGMQTGEAVEDAWKRCADDFECAKSCVEAYVNRYAGECGGVGDCERMSRLHNGGPSGCSSGATDAYWNSVNACCGCS